MVARAAAQQTGFPAAVKRCAGASGDLRDDTQAHVRRPVDFDEIPRLHPFEVGAYLLRVFEDDARHSLAPPLGSVVAPGHPAGEHFDALCPAVCPGDDGLDGLPDFVKRNPQRRGDHAHRLHEADVPDDASVTPSGVEFVERSAHPLRLHHRRAERREIVHAPCAHRPDVAADARKRDDQRVQHESGVDPRSQHRHPVGFRESVDRGRRLRRRPPRVRPLLRDGDHVRSAPHKLPYIPFGPADERRYGEQRDVGFRKRSGGAVRHDDVRKTLQAEQLPQRSPCLLRVRIRRADDLHALLLVEDARHERPHAPQPPHNNSDRLHRLPP